MAAKGSAIPFFSIGVKAIKGVISAASGVNDSLGKSKELRQAMRKTQQQLEYTVAFIRSVGEHKDCKLPEQVLVWSMECIGHAKQLLGDSDTLLARADEDWKRATFMNAKGFAEGLAEEVGGALDIQSFDPRTLALYKLEDMDTLLQEILLMAQAYVTLYSLHGSGDNLDGFATSQEQMFPARIWIQPLLVVAVEPGGSLKISWKSVGSIPRVDIKVSHDMAGEHHVTSEFWKRTPITPEEGLANTGEFEWSVDTEKPGDHWIYISAHDSLIDCPTDSVDIKVEKREVKAFDSPAAAKGFSIGSTSWTVGCPQKIEVKVAQLVTKLTLIAVWNGKNDKDDEAAVVLIASAAECSNGVCKLGWKPPVEMYAAQQLDDWSHWSLRAYVPDENIDLNSGVPAMSLEEGCVESTKIKLKLETGEVSSVVLSNTKGLARRRAKWAAGSTQLVKWKSDGFQFPSVRIQLELQDTIDTDTCKKIELAAAAPNLHGANQFEWQVDLPDGLLEQWEGRQLRVKVSPVVEMGVLRQKLSTVHTTRGADFKWPDANAIVKVTGCQSVITEVVAEEAHDSEPEALEGDEPPPPDYDQVVEDHASDRYTGAYPEEGEEGTPSGSMSTEI